MSAAAVQTLRRELRPVLEEMTADELVTYVQRIRSSSQMPWWARDAAIDLAHEVGAEAALREALRT